MTPHTDNSFADAVRELLVRRNISNVAIIDDEYQRVGTYVEVDTESRLDLFTAIQASEVAIEELGSLGVMLMSEHDLTDEVLDRLYSATSTLPTVNALMTQHRCVPKELSPFVSGLEETLRDSLQLQVLTFKPDHLGDDAASCQLVFVDYLLDEVGEDRSLAIAEKLGTRLRELGNRAVIILMSDKPNVDEAAWATFRDRAKFIGGTFHFFEKRLFANPRLFLFKLSYIADTFDEAGRVQSFVRQIEEKSTVIVDQLRSTIRSLTLQDYGYIERLSLQGEGQPLGDYLVWLYGAYFGQLAADATAEVKNELDRLHFSRVPDVGISPSTGFMGLYEKVVSEGVSLLDVPTQGVPPDIHLGDVFSGPNTEVLMVVTPECDLVFTEKDLGTRAFDSTRTVLLVPGEAREQNLGLSRVSHVTDYVMLGGKRVSVVWQPDRLRTIPLGEVAATLKAEGYERMSRLKAPFVLAVQNELLGKLSRIGKPVSPLPFVSVNATVWVTEGNSPVRKTNGRAMVYQDRDHAFHVLLDMACAEQILQLMSDCEDALTKAVQSKASSQHSGWLGDLRALKKNLDLHLSLVGPHKLPKKGGYGLIEAKPICISYGIGEFDQRWVAPGPICIDISADQ